MGLWFTVSGFRFRVSGFGFCRLAVWVWIKAFRSMLEGLTCRV
jgi:hypothetical protein